MRPKAGRRGSRARDLMRLARNIAVFLLGFALALELSARTEQYVVYGASPFEAYTYHDKLLAVDEHGLHGRPGGVYEKWRMNSLGFRGPEVADPKAEGVLRIATLGSSETFGLYESPDHEWPRELERALAQRGRPAEVVNAALVGMGLPERLKTFAHRVLPLEPDIAILMIEYPSFAGATPDDVATRLTTNSIQPLTHGAVSGLLTPRVGQLFNQALIRVLPDGLRTWVDGLRFERQAKANRRAIGDDYRGYREVTEAERSALLTTVEQFLELARKRGVRVVLVAPALSLDDAALFHASWPRVDVSWVADAQTTIDPELRRLAERFGAGFIDLDAELNGQQAELMVDYVHFNDAGARWVGAQLADAVIAELGDDGKAEDGEKVDVVGSDPGASDI